MTSYARPRPHPAAVRNSLWLTLTLTLALGALVVARLDHPNANVRIAMLSTLMDYPRPEARQRILDLETRDADPGVRMFAKSVHEWVDRGGRVKVHEREIEEWKAKQRAAGSSATSSEVSSPVLGSAASAR